MSDTLPDPSHQAFHSIDDCRRALRTAGGIFRVTASGQAQIWTLDGQTCHLPMRISGDGHDFANVVAEVRRLLMQHYRTAVVIDVVSAPASAGHPAEPFNAPRLVVPALPAAGAVSYLDLAKKAAADLRAAHQARLDPRSPEAEAALPKLPHRLAVLAILEQSDSFISGDVVKNPQLSAVMPKRHHRVRICSSICSVAAYAGLLDKVGEEVAAESGRGKNHRYRVARTWSEVANPYMELAAAQRLRYESRREDATKIARGLMPRVPPAEAGVIAAIEYRKRREWFKIDNLYNLYPLSQPRVGEKKMRLMLAVLSGHGLIKLGPDGQSISKLPSWSLTAATQAFGGEQPGPRVVPRAPAEAEASPHGATGQESDPEAQILADYTAALDERDRLRADNARLLERVTALEAAAAELERRKAAWAAVRAR